MILWRATRPPRINTKTRCPFHHAAKSLQSCPTLCDPIDGSPPGSPWDSPGKNTGVGCHFVLQCMKGKSESEVSQSCPTFRDPMDCSPPGSSVHGICQARILEWVAIAFSVYPHVNGIIQFVADYIWLLSLSIMLLRFIHGMSILHFLPGFSF